MGNAGTCPECGARACESRYNDFLALEFSDPAYGAVHHLTVAAYMLQHSSKLSQEGWLYERELLKEFLVNKKSPVILREQMRDFVDSGKRRFKIALRSGQPVIAKTMWIKTIMDVSSDNPATYCADVNTWAASVLQKAQQIQNKIFPPAGLSLFPHEPPPQFDLHYYRLHTEIDDLSNREGSNMERVTGKTVEAQKGTLHGMVRKPYTRLAAMAVLSFVMMYILMYVMVDKFDNVLTNMNQFYMAGLMAAPMVVIELLLMPGMYPNKKANIIIGAASLVLLSGFFLCVRQQVAIRDEEFLRSMIPHHAAAILMCEESSLDDPEIQALCMQISQSQQKEIDQMKAILERLDR